MPNYKPIRLEKLNYTAEKQKVAAATMLRRKFERSEQLLERKERARRDKIARENIRQTKALQKKRTTHETRDVEQTRTMKQTVANLRREQLKKENLLRLEKIAKRAARAKQRKERLMEDDADNLGEIETMQFSDDECCWDDRPPGRRGASRPLVDVFFDQPVLSHSRTIIGPLRLLGDGPPTAGDDLEDSLGTDDDDDDVDDYDNDVDDEKRQPEMNTTATGLTEQRREATCGQRTQELLNDDDASSGPSDITGGRDDLQPSAGTEKATLRPRLKNRLHQPRVDPQRRATPTGNSRSPPGGASVETGGAMTNAGGDCSVSVSVSVGVGVTAQLDASIGVVPGASRLPGAPTDSTNQTIKEADRSAEKEDRGLTLVVDAMCRCPAVGHSDDSTSTDHVLSPPFATSPPRPRDGAACGEKTPEQPKPLSPVAGSSTAADDKWRDTSPAQVRRRRV